MGFFEEMFDPRFMFDTEHAQRADIHDLQDKVTELTARTNARVPVLERQVSQLLLLCNALVELVERKGVGTREELQVLVQQIDLLDGREDGKQSAEAWRNAPRCTSCNHYINPQREACIYCGQPIPRAQGGGHGPYRGGPLGPSAPAPRTATCAKCGSSVPQSETFFTEEGQLWCSSCYR